MNLLAFRVNLIKGGNHHNIPYCRVTCEIVTFTSNWISFKLAFQVFQKLFCDISKSVSRFKQKGDGTLNLTSLSSLLPSSLCTPAASCATVNLRTGAQAPWMGSLGAMGPSWLTPCLRSLRPCCGKHRGVSSLMRCPLCPSPCWERSLCGSVRAAARVWKKRRGGAPRRRRHR